MIPTPKSPKIFDPRPDTDETTCSCNGIALAGVVGVPPLLLHEFIACAFFRPEFSPSENASMWKGARLLCLGGGVEAAASHAGFVSVSEFIRAFEHYHGCGFSRFREAVKAGDSSARCCPGGDPASLPSALREKCSSPVGVCIQVIHAFARLGCRPFSIRQRVSSPLPAADLLHVPVLERRPDARNLQARLLLDPLMKGLASEYPAADDHLRCNAVGDALHVYYSEPSRFDPRRGSLKAFLKSIARRKMANELRSEKRRRRLTFWEHGSSGCFAHSFDEIAGSPPAWEMLELHERTEELRSRIDALSKLLKQSDRQFLRLLMQQERDPQKLAEALGVSDRSPAEQNRAIKNAKARIRYFARKSVNVF